MDGGVILSIAKSPWMGKKENRKEKASVPLAANESSHPSQLDDNLS